MAKKKNDTNWIGIVIVGFFIISAYPILIPFIIVGVIIYFSMKNKGVKGQHTFSGNKNKEIYSTMMNSDIVKNFRETNPEIFKNLDDGFLKKQEEVKYSKSSLKYNKPEPIKSKIKRVESSQKTRTNISNSKITPVKVYKSSFSPKMKKQKTYDYNKGGSIWDDYETVVDTMAKNK